MDIKYILSSENPVETTSYTVDNVDNAYSRYETAARKKWITDTTLKPGTNYFTTNHSDSVDCITVTPNGTYSVEIKNLRASISTSRYATSQLYEETKHKHQQHLQDSYGYKPLFVRYFTDGRRIFEIDKIDFGNYVTIDNPEGAKDNSRITSLIDEASGAGKLVRCHNWWATKATARSRYDKTQKDVWFIPNFLGSLHQE